MKLERKWRDLGVPQGPQSWGDSGPAGLFLAVLELALFAGIGDGGVAVHRSVI